MRNRILAALLAFGLLAALLPVRAGNPAGAVYSTATDRVFWFVHASDIHVGMRGTNDTSRLTWLVTTGKTVIDPSFMVVTGDLTDSTNANILGLPNGPYQAEWDAYKSILDGNGAGPTFFYDLPGNHDAYNDRNFAYYLANSVQGRDKHTTQISWTKTFAFGTYHFLGVNSCDNTGASFSLTWPFGDYAGLDQGELDFIGARLAENAAADLTFVFGHHPVTDTGASDDTWLFYGHQPFISALDVYRASLYGYGHTHDVSDVQFAGNSYTGPMINGGVRYENIASVGKSSSNNYDIVAVDCNGVSSVPATLGTWPVVLITAPTARRLGTTVNPYAYAVPAASANPVRALVFDAATVTSVAFKCDAEATWHPMTRVTGNAKLWQGVWNASALAAGEHTLTVQAVGTYDEEPHHHGPGRGLDREQGARGRQRLLQRESGLHPVGVRSRRPGERFGPGRQSHHRRPGFWPGERGTDNERQRLVHLHPEHRVLGNGQLHLSGQRRQPPKQRGHGLDHRERGPGRGGHDHAGRIQGQNQTADGPGDLEPPAQCDTDGHRLRTDDLQCERGLLFADEEGLPGSSVRDGHLDRRRHGLKNGNDEIAHRRLRA